MQEDKTSSILIPSTPIPPIPITHVERVVYVTAVPASSSLRYVFEKVMSGERGTIGWDMTGDNLILYLKVEEIDHVHFPELMEGTEIWALFTCRGE